MDPDWEEHVVIPADVEDAACVGDTATMAAWFAAGTRDLEARKWDDCFGGFFSLLDYASKFDRADVVRWLLARGARVDGRDEMGYTALHLAGSSGSLAAAGALLDAGADVNAHQTPVGDAPLVKAARFGHLDMIRLLLSRGASLDARSSCGLIVDADARLEGCAAAAALLAAVRVAGGWDAYVRYPRFKVLALRVLCERGRASTDDALLTRVFPWHAPFTVPTTRAARRARRGRTRAHARLPREVFWLILKFWRSDRDFRGPPPPRGPS